MYIPVSECLTKDLRQYIEDHLGVRPHEVRRKTRHECIVLLKENGVLRLETSSVRAPKAPDISQKFLDNPLYETQTHEP